MKVVKCDICGKEMKIGVKVAIEAQVVEFKDIFGELPKIKNIGAHDICLECSDKIAKFVDKQKGAK